jgi:GTP cyclohydrolase II
LSRRYFLSLISSINNHSCCRSQIDTLENKHAQELDHIQQRLNEIGISKGSRLFPARDRSHSDGSHLEDGSCCAPAAVETPSKTAPKRNLNAPLYNHRIVLTTYPGQLGVNPIPLSWGAKTAMERGPILVSRNPQSLKMRNAIGAHGGSYCVYRALAVAIGELSPTHKPDFFNTQPPISFGPFPQWSDPEKIVSLDPWGHIPVAVFAEHLKNGLDIRPSIAMTKAHMRVPEIENSLRDKKMVADGHVCLPNGDLVVTKGAIEPVWYLPGVAKRFGVDEVQLRRALFEDCGGMYPELITRPDLKVFLPPIGGISVYIFGNPAFLSDPTKELALRIHDECNGSDVFGSGKYPPRRVSLPSFAM